MKKAMPMIIVAIPLLLSARASFAAWPENKCDENLCIMYRFAYTVQDDMIETIDLDGNTTYRSRNDNYHAIAVTHVNGRGTNIMTYNCDALNPNDSMTTMSTINGGKDFIKNTISVGTTGIDEIRTICEIFFPSWAKQ